MAVCSCGVGGVYGVRTAFASSGGGSDRESSNARGKRGLNLRNFFILLFHDRVSFFSLFVWNLGFSRVIIVNYD